MQDGSTVVDGQQINWVVSEWGSFPYAYWMYVEVNQQDAIGKQPGDNQVPVTLGNVELHFRHLPSEVTQMIIGVKTIHDTTDQTVTERGRFDVVNGSVGIPLDYGDLVAYFGVTHYSIWFQAVGGKNGHGVTCGEIALSGVMPNGQTMMFQKNVCFGTNPSPAPVPSTYIITAAAAGGGTITPSGNVAVSSGANQSFTITSPPALELNYVSVDGVSQGAIYSYTFTNVITNHSIVAYFLVKPI